MRKGILVTGAAGFFAVSLALAGCSSGGGEADPAGTWGQSGAGQPQLVLAKDGGLSGTDGCNTLTGTWEKKDDKVSFGPVASTLMACDGVDAWLSALNSATISGTTMTVLDQGGAKIGTLDKQ